MIPKLPSSVRHVLTRSVRSFATTGNFNGNKFYDIAIIGAGLVGSSLACALNSIPSKNKICLIDRSPIIYKSLLPEGTFSNRAVSLNPTTIDLLREINVWKNINVSRVHDYGHIRVWDSQSDGRLAFDAPKSSKSHLASILERGNLQNALNKSLEECSQSPNLELFPHRTVKRVSRANIDPEAPFALENPLEVTLDNDERIRANVVVGADGIDSIVRRVMGSQAVGWDYGQKCLVGTMEIDTPDGKNRTAWQRFLPCGPVALLPISDTYASLAWSITTEYAEAIEELSAIDVGRLVNIALNFELEDILFLLNRIKESGPNQVDMKDEVGWRWRTLKKSQEPPPKVVSVDEGSVQSYPLKMRHSTQYFDKDGFVLVGDAAHIIHPLAGQGLNLGMSDVKAFKSAVQFAVDSGHSLRHPNVMQRYANERYLENLVMMTGVDTLNAVFSQSWLAPVRGLAVNLANSNTFIKNMMMSRTTG